MTFTLRAKQGRSPVRFLRGMALGRIDVAPVRHTWYTLGKSTIVHHWDSPVRHTWYTLWVNLSIAHPWAL